MSPIASGLLSSCRVPLLSWLQASRFYISSKLRFSRRQRRTEHVIVSALSPTLINEETISVAGNVSNIRQWRCHGRGGNTARNWRILKTYRSWMVSRDLQSGCLWHVNICKSHAWSPVPNPDDNVDAGWETLWPAATDMTWHTTTDRDDRLTSVGATDTEICDQPSQTVSHWTSSCFLTPPIACFHGCTQTNVQSLKN